MRAVTFGEIMLRLSPCGYKRLVQADCFEAVYGGAEANVAVSLAQFGCDSVYVTRLPQNDLAKACRVNLQNGEWIRQKLFSAATGLAFIIWKRHIAAPFECDLRSGGFGVCYV